MKHTPEYDSEHLTPAEKAVERMLKKPNCFYCESLQTHPKSGFRGCVVGNDVKAVLSGFKPCEDFDDKRRKNDESTNRVDI